MLGGTISHKKLNKRSHEPFKSILFIQHGCQKTKSNINAPKLSSQTIFEYKTDRNENHDKYNFSPKVIARIPRTHYFSNEYFYCATNHFLMLHRTFPCRHTDDARNRAPAALTANQVTAKDASWKQFLVIKSLELIATGKNSSRWPSSSTSRNGQGKGNENCQQLPLFVGRGAPFHWSGRRTQHFLSLFVRNSEHRIVEGFISTENLTPHPSTPFIYPHKNGFQNNSVPRNLPLYETQTMSSFLC